MSTTLHQTAPEAAQYEERVARAIVEEDLHQEETIEQAHRLFSAAEPGFGGDLRRAIHANQRSIDWITKRTGVDGCRISNSSAASRT